jgi:hypothetical protein
VLCIRTAFLTKLKFTGTKIKATKHFTQKKKPPAHPQRDARAARVIGKKLTA